MHIPNVKKHIYIALPKPEYFIKKMSIVLYATTKYKNIAFNIYF